MGRLSACAALGLAVGGHHHVPARGVNRPSPACVELGGVAEVLGDEALAGGLLRDAHAATDVGPRRARAAGLVDEVADEVVGQVAEVVGGDHRVGELFERVVVDLLDGVDEVVEADVGGDGWAHATTFRLSLTSDNPGLSMAEPMLRRRERPVQR